MVPALDPDRANAMRVGMCRSNQFWGWVLRLRVGHGPDHEQAKEAAMSVVSFALALPLVLLFVALLTYLLARALLLVGPPGAYRHRPPRGRHP